MVCGLYIMSSYVPYSQKNIGNLTHALSLNCLLCLCRRHTNMDSFNVLFIVSSYSLLKHFSKQKAGDLISYTFLWTASMLVPNVRNASISVQNVLRLEEHGAISSRYSTRVIPQWRLSIKV